MRSTLHDRPQAVKTVGKLSVSKLRAEVVLLFHARERSANDLFGASGSLVSAIGRGIAMTRMSPRFTRSIDFRMREKTIVRSTRVAGRTPHFSSMMRRAAMPACLPLARDR